MKLGLNEEIDRLIAEIHFEHELIEKRSTRYTAAVAGALFVSAFFIGSDVNARVEDWVKIGAAVVLALSVSTMLGILGAFFAQRSYLSKLNMIYENNDAGHIYSDLHSSISILGIMSAMITPALAGACAALSLIFGVPTNDFF